MPVIYNGNYLVPGPMATVTKLFDTTEDGRRIGAKFGISLQGKLVVHKGSPNSSGGFATTAVEPADEVINSDSYLTVMLRKMEALRTLFATEGKTLQIQGYDSGSPWSCNPRLKGPIEFQRGPTTSWYNVLDFTVNLEADFISGPGMATGEDNFPEKIERASETWTMEPTDEIGRVYKLTHAVFAKGKRTYSTSGTIDTEAWQQASGYCLNRITLGIDLNRMGSPGILNLGHLNAYNYTRRQTIGELDGTFNLDETWTCISGSTPAIETYTVTKRTAELNKASVSIEGSVQGLEVRNNTSYALTSSRWANAKTQWTTTQADLKTRAQNATGLTLNATPLNNSVSYNEINGIINYTYEFDNRAGNQNTDGDVVSEKIDFSYDLPNRLYAEIPILGRNNGPILQDIVTRTSKKKTVAIECLVSGTTLSYTATMPDYNSIVSGFAPTSSVRFLAGDRESWNEKEGRYSRQTTWIYE